MKIKRKIPVTLLSEGKVALRWNRKNKYAIGLVLSAAFPKDSLNMLGYKSTPIIADPKNHNEWDHARIWSGMKVYDASQFYIPESLYKEMTTKNVDHFMPSSRKPQMFTVCNPSTKSSHWIHDEFLVPAKGRNSGVILFEHDPNQALTGEKLEEAKKKWFSMFPGMQDFWNEIKPISNLAEAEEARKKVEGEYFTPVRPLEKQPDLVNHPPHYTSGKIEVIDFIEDQKLGMHLGNSVKYIARAGKKDPSKTVQDLEKAIWYIKRFIGKYEKAN